MTPIKLPTLGYFQNGNDWLGSSGALRFQLENSTPRRESDREEGKVYQLTAVLWQGPFSRPYAQEVGRETFPLTGEGLNALLGFLSVRAREMADRPVFTAEETAAFYQAKKREELSPS